MKKCMFDTDYIIGVKCKKFNLDEEFPNELFVRYVQDTFFDEFEVNKNYCFWNLEKSIEFYKECKLRCLISEGFLLLDEYLEKEINIEANNEKIMNDWGTEKHKVYIKDRALNIT